MKKKGKTEHKKELKEISNTEEEIINEKRLWNLRNIIYAFIIGFIIIFSFVIILIFYDLNLTYSIVLACILITIYSVILFFLLEPSILKEIQKKVTIEKPIEKFKKEPYPVVHETEKRIYVTNPVKPLETEKRIYITNPIKLKKDDFKKYKFIGSPKTMIYHKTSSRFARLIKKENRVFGNDESYFIQRGYRKAQTRRNTSKKSKK